MSSKLESVIIYYFSGTGNSRNVAWWIADEAEKAGLHSSVINIAGINRKQIETPPRKSLVGFCSPTHGFNFPSIMLNFLWRFPKSDNDVFIVNTRAGMKLWKIPLVGLTGIAQIFAAVVLKFKGYRIRGMRPVDLPSNWLIVHPGIREKVVDSMFIRCERQVRKFAVKILNGRKNYRALYDIIQDLLISPVAIGYYLIGRFVLAKSLIASRDCDSCNLCIKSCPVKAIKEIDNRPFWTIRCESCMQCINICPKRAIQTAHGLVIGALYLIMTVGMEYLYFLTVDHLPAGWLKNLFYNGSFRFTIASALAIPFLLISYRITHYLMRFPVIERFIVYTSLTVWKFWRRYRIRKPVVEKK